MKSLGHFATPLAHVQPSASHTSVISDYRPRRQEREALGQWDFSSSVRDIPQRRLNEAPHAERICLRTAGAVGLRLAYSRE